MDTNALSPALHIPELGSDSPHDPSPPHRPSHLHCSPPPEGSFPHYAASLSPTTSNAATSVSSVTVGAVDDPVHDLSGLPPQEPLDSVSTLGGGLDSHLASNDSPAYYSKFRKNPRPQSIWRQWLIDILLGVVSFCSFIIIVVVLKVYDGQPVPNLRMNISLNTFLAFFTTLTRASFMTIISQALSQWKWNIFSSNNGGVGYQGRPVSDIQLLDAASRGTWGSILLLLNIRWKHVVSTAAIISIISIFTSPITQQMISFQIRPEPTGGIATVPVSRTALDDNSLIPLYRTSTIASLGDIQNPILPLDASCQSGNCTFLPYSSLAVCFKMHNVTDRLELTYIKNSKHADWTGGLGYFIEDPIRPAWNASLPNGVNFVTPLPYGSMVTTAKDPVNFGGDAVDNFSALSYIFVIWTNTGNVTRAQLDDRRQPWRFGAVEILVHACVNTYTTTVISGNSHTDIISSSNMPSPVKDNWPLPLFYCQYIYDESGWGQGCEKPNSTGGVQFSYFEDPSADDSPGKNRSTPLAFDHTLAAKLSLSVIESMDSLIVANDANRTDTTTVGLFPPGIIEALYTNKYETRNWSDQFDGLSVFSTNLAVSYSNFLRTTNGSTLFHGTAFVPETFVQITWGWLAFIAAQLVFSYIFLFLTIVRTARLGVPVFKDSEFATLLAPTEEIQRAVLVGTDGRGVGDIPLTAREVEEAEKRGQSVMVKLGDDGRLVLV